MKNRSLIALSAAAALASGCNTTVDTGGGSRGSSAPTYAHSALDTPESKKVSPGLTGLLVSANPVTGSTAISNTKVVLSADHKLATVYINGINTGTLTHDELGIYYRSGTGASTKILSDITVFPGQYYGVSSYDHGVDQGVMITGVETHPSNLPTASATYTGEWTAIIHPSSLGATDAAIGGGTSTFNVNFANGDFDGTFADDGGLGTNAALTGRIVENGVSGTAAFSGTHSGNIALEGTFFGPVANDVAGVISGSVNSTGGSHALHGWFGASK